MTPLLKKERKEKDWWFSSLGDSQAKATKIAMVILCRYEVQRVCRDSGKIHRDVIMRLKKNLGAAKESKQKEKPPAR